MSNGQVEGGLGCQTLLYQSPENQQPQPCHHKPHAETDHLKSPSAQNPLRTNRADKLMVWNLLVAVLCGLVCASRGASAWSLRLFVHSFSAQTPLELRDLPHCVHDGVCAARAGVAAHIGCRGGNSVQTAENWPKNTCFQHVWATEESNALKAWCSWLRTTEISYLSLHFDGIMVDGDVS